MEAGAGGRFRLVTRFGVLAVGWDLLYGLVTCSCGRRRGGTRTAARSATCSWPTTSGTRPRSGRGCRSSTASAARTSSTRAALERLVASLSPAAGPGTGRGRRGGGPGVRRVPAAGRHLRAGRAVAAAGHRPGDARGLLAGPPAGRRRPSGCCSRWSPTGRWPRRRSWPPPRWISEDVHIDGPAGDERRRLLPGDGLAARRSGTPLEKAGLRPGRRPAQPRGRPAVLRHHLHLLRDRRRRRAGRPRRARATASRRRRRRRRRRPGRPGSGPTASPRTTATTCPRS